jgi:hypothetical protein
LLRRQHKNTALTNTLRGEMSCGCAASAAPQSVRLEYGRTSAVASSARTSRKEIAIKIYSDPNYLHTLGTDKADIQIFLKAHNERNLAEYEGRMDIDKKLLADLIRCAKKLEAALRKHRPL